MFKKEISVVSDSNLETPVVEVYGMYCTSCTSDPGCGFTSHWLISYPGKINTSDLIWVTYSKSHDTCINKLVFIVWIYGFWQIVCPGILSNSDYISGSHWPAYKRTEWNFVSSLNNKACARESLCQSQEVRLVRLWGPDAGLLWLPAFIPHKQELHPANFWRSFD